MSQPSMAGVVAQPVAVAVGFSSSREQSNPGMGEQASPRAGRITSHDPGSTPPSGGGGRDAGFGAFGIFAAHKRKRSPTPSSAEAVTATLAQQHNLQADLHANGVYTPSPVVSAQQRELSGSAHMHSGAATHSPHGMSMQSLSGAASSSELQQQQQQQVERLASELAEAQRLLAEKTEALGVAQGELAAERETSSSLRSELDSARAELDGAKAEAEASRGLIAGMKSEIEEIRTEQERGTERQAKGKEALRAALRERCFRSRSEAKERLARESVRLGTLEPDGKAFSTGWVQRDGTALVALVEREKALEARKAQLEEDRKALRKRKTPSAKGGGAGGGGAEASMAATAGDGSRIGGGGYAGADVDEMELADLEESLALRGSLLTKERAELLAERRQLEREAQEHFAELRLMQELEAIEPEMRDCPSLPLDGQVYEPAAPPGANTPANSAKRFVFLDLIAQGGFSCVFRAYDLQRHEYAACKLHRMSDGWADARKEAFVRHVEREMEITVGVRHRRIVDTFAAFEVSQSTVVSVMPYCNGGSLAELLRKHGPLSERDAKSIMLQLLYGLRHLHSRPQPIIHYDLKPANILFHDGEVKLSDFGLSKVMAAKGGGSGGAGSSGGGGASHQGMELTSYGSGTHGYLPPECYDGDASRVCPKVDVFSAGVVHFVMLFYPHKPFFRQQTQQQIMNMKAHAIQKETETLEFPGKISAEAQAFLRRALAPKREDRPDVNGLLADPHMQGKSK